MVIATPIEPILPALDNFELKPKADPDKARSHGFLESGKRLHMALTLFDHVMIFSLPHNWKPLGSKSKEGYLKYEYAPLLADEGQTLSIEGFENYHQYYSAQNLLDSYVQNANQRCAGVSLFEAMSPKVLNGYSAVQAIYGCATENRQASKKSEMAYVLVVEVDKHLYLLNKRVRTAPFNMTDAPLTVETLDAFLEPLTPLLVCHPEQRTLGCEKWTRS